MTERETLEKEIARFWNLPRLEHGKSQVPYLYDESWTIKMNRLAELRRQ